MSLPLAETVSFPAGTGWAVPGFQELVDSVFKYFGSAWPMWCLFFIGIWLGYLVFGRKRSRAGDSTRAAPEEAAVSETEPTDERESKERQWVAELEGELSAARKMGDQQRSEMEGLQARFESARRELDEKQDRFTELSESLKEAASQPAGQASLAHARAPVIHLDEVVRRERRRLESDLSRLQHLEDRLTAENETVWRCVKSVAAIHDEIRNDPAANDGPARELVRKTGVVDEHLRVFHQNARGCLQGIAGSKSRLRSEETKLEGASALVARAEAALAGLAATEDRTDGAAVKAAFFEASARLLESRPIIESLENGIDQEIAEMTGRIDWVARDSPKNFLKALDDLNRCEAPESAEIAEKASEIRRLLNEAKSAPARVELALSADAGGEPELRCGKRAILEAYDRAVKTLEPSAATPVVPAEAENNIAHLERQLFLRECETKRLDRELKSRTRELRQFRKEKEKRGRVLEAAVLPGRDASGGNFVRRLLGFGSGGIQSGIEQPAPFSDSHPETEAPAATLAEAREILSELKLTSSHGSGNGGAEPDSTQKDVPPSESNPPPPREAEPELTRLRDRTTRQQSRIDELEKTIAELRKAGIASLQIDPFLKPGPPGTAGAGRGGDRSRRRSHAGRPGRSGRERTGDLPGNRPGRLGFRISGFQR